MRTCGQEAHVGHAVGFVDHHDLDGREIHEALLQQVGEAAGRGHHDRRATAERLRLEALGRAAVDREHEEPTGLGQRHERLAHLEGQLARRHQDEAGRSVGLGLRDPLDERDAEGEGLARPGRGAAAEVAPGERVRESGGLDGERLLDAGVLEHADEVVGYAERGERGHEMSWLLLIDPHERGDVRPQGQHLHGQLFGPCPPFPGSLLKRHSTG